MKMRKYIIPETQQQPLTLSLPILGISRGTGEDSSKIKGDAVDPFGGAAKRLYR